VLAGRRDHLGPGAAEVDVPVAVPQLYGDLGRSAFALRQGASEVLLLLHLDVMQEGDREARVGRVEGDRLRGTSLRSQDLRVEPEVVRDRQQPRRQHDDLEGRVHGQVSARLKEDVLAAAVVQPRYPAQCGAQLDVLRMQQLRELLTGAQL
jgi:hypothetical protein